MRALLLIALLGFMGCSKSPQVAGATSETTNGDIKAVVVNADGTAAARVRVAVIDDEDWIG